MQLICLPKRRLPFPRWRSSAPVRMLREVVGGRRRRGGSSHSIRRRRDHAAALLDVFLTVLCARSGTSILSERLGRAVWSACRAFAHAVPRLRRVVLAYA